MSSCQRIQWNSVIRMSYRLRARYFAHYFIQMLHSKVALPNYADVCYIDVCYINVLIWILQKKHWVNKCNSKERLWIYF